VSSKAIDLGLVRVSTEQLQTMLRGVHRGTLECPLAPASLAGHGLQDVSNEILAHMRNLDRAAVHAVLVAVLAERMNADADRQPPPGAAELADRD
jgi:hypothetical protein